MNTIVLFYLFLLFFLYRSTFILSFNKHFTVSLMGLSISLKCLGIPTFLLCCTNRVVFTLVFCVFPLNFRRRLNHYFFFFSEKVAYSLTLLIFFWPFSDIIETIFLTVELRNDHYIPVYLVTSVFKYTHSSLLKTCLYMNLYLNGFIIDTQIHQPYQRRIKIRNELRHNRI